ncbi:MAG: nucleoside phosphorylase [Gammaproteobacteria bacterium]|nr:nucleoside phosphorylase [Gammaproteobacteria bacterium]
MFNPIHLNITADDMAGNHGRGRYVLLPGSDGRAEQIASHFQNVTVRRHARGHHCYLGQLDSSIDVMTVSSGMGCPSMEIILHELFTLGARRFLRVGTAGALQSFIQLGDLVNATASVRDEKTTYDYVPEGFPAIASPEMHAFISQAAEKINLQKKLHHGIVHCKASFYAREFGKGPYGERNEYYMALLAQSGVLATEMETSTLFVQSGLYAHQCRQVQQYLPAVMCAAILGIVAVPPHEFMRSEQQIIVVNDMIQLALETLRQLAKRDFVFPNLSN